MFRPSAKVWILPARPSGRKSERILTESRPGVPAGFGNGYSSVSVTQSRPRSSKARLSGLWMSGSAATSWISNPGGRCSALRSSSGVRGGNDETFSTGAGVCARLAPDRSRAENDRSTPIPTTRRIHASASSPIAIRPRVSTGCHQRAPNAPARPGSFQAKNRRL